MTVIDPDVDICLRPAILPLNMHSRRKSDNDICSLRIACDLVMKFLAWPEVPGSKRSATARLPGVGSSSTFLLDLRHDDLFAGAEVDFSCKCATI